MNYSDPTGTVLIPVIIGFVLIFTVFLSMSGDTPSGTSSTGSSSITPGKIIDIEAEAAAATVDATAIGVTNVINTAERPRNIGKGLYAKQKLTTITKISSASAVVNNILGKVTYVGSGLDVITGVVENYSNGLSTKKIAWDFLVDGIFAISTASVSGYVGAMLGSPGNIPGVIIGAAMGIGYSYVLDEMLAEPKRRIKSAIR